MPRGAFRGKSNRSLSGGRYSGGKRPFIFGRGRGRGRGRGGYSNDRPYKKRRISTPKLSPEESKEKCLKIIKTFKSVLQQNFMNLMDKQKTTESTVGITAFANNTNKTFKPITANLKKKYEDFIVSEIDESGKVAKIIKSEPIKGDSAADTDAELSDIISKVKDELSALTDSETTEKFIEWYKQGMSILHKTHLNAISMIEDEEDDDIFKNEFEFSENNDKQSRGAMHKLLKQLHFLDSKTNADNCIGVVINNRKQQNKRWPKSRGAYLKFTLLKCGMDNGSCLSKLNANLHRNSSAKTLCIAGTKDKHAITTQNVTAFHVTSNEMIKATKDMSNCKVGNFEYVDKELKLGNLQGNEFQIVLRNIKYDHGTISEKEAAQELQARIKIMKTIGFINYFGLQRFGSSTVGTHDIGRAIIANKLSLACALMIMPRNGETPKWAEGRQAFVENGVMDVFPRQLYAEKKCLYGLLDDDQNYQQAMMRIPRNLRTMYVHAYQSFVWNQVATQRVQQHGYEVVIGDIVWRKSMDDEEEKQWEKDEVVYVSKENIDEYSIFDVVLPMPSPNCMLPKLDTAEFMKDLLLKDGLSLEDDFNKDKGSEQAWGLHAAYRNIMVLPKEMEGQVKEYESDQDFLLDVPFDSHSKNDNMKNKETMDVEQDEDDDDVDMKKRVAWIVKFQLQKSSYATMCVRQLLFTPSDKLTR